MPVKMTREQYAALKKHAHPAKEALAHLRVAKRREDLPENQLEKQIVQEAELSQVIAIDPGPEKSALLV